MFYGSPLGGAGHDKEHIDGWVQDYSNSIVNLH